MLCSPKEVSVFVVYDGDLWLALIRGSHMGRSAAGF